MKIESNVNKFESDFVGDFKINLKYHTKLIYNL